MLVTSNHTVSTGYKAMSTHTEEHSITGIEGKQGATWTPCCMLGTGLVTPECYPCSHNASQVGT